MDFLGRLFFGGITSLPRAFVEASLVFRDDVAVGLLLRELATGAGLGGAGIGRARLGSLDLVREAIEMRGGADLPRARLREIARPELPALETALFVCPNRRRASLGSAFLLFRRALRRLRPLPGPDGVAELRRCGIDAAIAVLAQGLERVLRVPRHGGKGQN